MKGGKRLSLSVIEIRCSMWIYKFSLFDCCKTILYIFFLKIILWTWLEKLKKLEMFLIIKITNHQTKEKVINTESNVTLKSIYKCFVVGNNCWRQNFHASWLYFIGNRTTSILSWILDKSISKPKKVHIYTKRRQSPWSKTHGDIILTKPMVQAHGTTSHFWLMI